MGQLPGAVVFIFGSATLRRGIPLLRGCRNWLFGVELVASISSAHAQDLSMSASLDLANGRAVWTDAASSLPAAPPLGVVLLPTLRPQISGSTLDPDISVGDLSIVTIGRGDQLSGADSGYFLLAASGSELVPNDSSGVSIWSFNKNTGVGAPLDIHVPLRVPSISNGSTHLSLMGADPEPQFDWTITATGKFGAGKAPALNRMSVYDTADASKVGAQPAALGEQDE